MFAAHGDYSSIANWRIEIPAILRDMFGMFRGISKILCIYPTIYRGIIGIRRTLMGKQRSEVPFPWFSRTGAYREIPSKQVYMEDGAQWNSTKR